MKEETAMREINFYPETDLERSGIVNGLTNVVADVLTDPVRGPYLSVKQGMPDRYRLEWRDRMGLLLDEAGVTMKVETGFERIEIGIRELIALKETLKPVSEAGSTESDKAIAKAISSAAKQVCEAEDKRFLDEASKAAKAIAGFNNKMCPCTEAQIAGYCTATCTDHVAGKSSCGIDSGLVEAMINQSKTSDEMLNSNQ